MSWEAFNQGSVSAAAKARRLTLEDRMRGARAVVDGSAVADVASVFGVSRRTVQRWVQAYRLHGERLPEKVFPRGRPPSVGSDARRKLARALCHAPPKEIVNNAPFWTVSYLQRFLHQSEGLTASRSTVYHLLEVMGLRLRTPTQAGSPWAQPEGARWIENVYPEVGALARRAGANMLFVECLSLDSDYFPMTTVRCAEESNGCMKVPARLVFAGTVRGDWRWRVVTGQHDPKAALRFFIHQLVAHERRLFVMLEHALKLDVRTDSNPSSLSRNGRIQVFPLRLSKAGASTATASAGKHVFV